MRKTLLLTGTVALALGAPIATTTTGAPPASSTPITTSTPIFSSDSFWYRQLPADAPLDPQSTTKMANLVKAGNNNTASYYKDYGQPQMPINTKAYSPPYYITSNSDPMASFTWDNCWHDGPARGKEVLAQFAGLHVPTNAVPAEGTDGEMTLYNRDTDQYTDLWRVKKLGTNSYQVCGGGTLSQASKSQGVFSKDFGTTGSGLAMAGGMIKADELRKGEINHAIGMSLPPSVVNAEGVGVATKSDGNSKDSTMLGAQEGQYLRLPANLDLSKYHFNKTQLAVAKAAQKYGFIIWDRSSGITLRAENPLGMPNQTDPYDGQEALFGGLGWWGVLSGNKEQGEDPFPFDKLVAVTPGYIPPVSTTTVPPSATPTISEGWSAQGFSFTSSSLPAGGKLQIYWTQNGQGQSTSTTSTRWASGQKTGWSNAYAVVVDATGKVVTTSYIVNPTGRATVRGYQLLPSGGQDSFTVRATTMPPGGTLNIWWYDGSTKHYDQTINYTWTSPTTRNWHWVYSELQDAQGRTVDVKSLSH